MLGPHHSKTRTERGRSPVLRDTDGYQFLHKPIHSHLKTTSIPSIALAMPRLHPRIFHHARKIDPLLPLVLQATRDLASAKNELRWLKEFITTQHQHPSDQIHQDLSNRRLRKLCIDRSRGKPLQYILGSEYFGDLEIACEKGVLIPR
jgi:methylase of polypeptide subunit release factors